MLPTDILLTDRVAVVTGGAGGIGKGIASGLAAAGASVVIVDTDAASGAATMAEIIANGGQAQFEPADVTDRAALRGAIDAAAARFGRLDILINNAGGCRPVSFMAQSERSRDRHVELNLGSLFTATHHAVEHMIRGGRGGAIVNIASIEGQRAAPRFAVYAACKAAMISFTRSAAVELAEHRIRVNALAPDIVVTDGMIGLAPDTIAPATLAARKAYIPLGRDGTLADCAGAATFLVSDMASYITGTTLNVDGGTWASSGWTRGGPDGWRLFPVTEA